MIHLEDRLDYWSDLKKEMTKAIELEIQLERGMDSK